MCPVMVTLFYISASRKKTYLLNTRSFSIECEHITTDEDGPPPTVSRVGERTVCVCYVETDNFPALTYVTGYVTMKLCAILCCLPLFAFYILWYYNNKKAPLNVVFRIISYGFQHLQT